VTENQELAALGWKHFNAGDFEALLELIHPDVEWRPAQGPGGMEGRVIRGREEYRRWLNELSEVWDEFRAEELEFHDLEDGRLVTIGYLVGVGRGSGARVRVPFSQLNWISDGRLARIDAYLDHDGAREAARLG